MRIWPEKTVDQEFADLAAAGHFGALNDRQFSYLRSLGFTGGLADMMFQLRLTGGAAAPIITGVPTISGTIRTGQVLTATPASVSGSPTPTRTWQWVRAGVDIVGATAQTYTITNLDEGRNITVRQIETNGSGSANATSTATAVPFLLDQLTATAVAAYSFRKLRSAANLAARFRRTDNTEQDFGFNADGAFDFAAYDTFVGAGTARGRTWYDQSANAVPYEQTDVNRQPSTRISGVDDTVGGKLAWTFKDTGSSANYFSRTPFLFAAGTVSASFALQSTVPGDTAGLLNERNGAAGNTGASYGIRRETSNNAGFEIRNDASTQTAITQGLISAVFDQNVNIFSYRDTGSQIQGFSDGQSATPYSYTRGAGPYTFNVHLFGGTYIFGGTGSNIKTAEAIYFDSVISDLDLNTIIASQGGEYGSAVVPFLSDVERLQLINGTGDGGSSFGVNLGAPNESNDHMFMDFAKSCRGWVYADLNTRLPVENQDAEEAMASLPSGQSTMHFFFSSINDGNGAFADPQPNFASRVRLSFTGSATVNFANAGTNVTQINPNTFEFDCDFAGNKWLVFTPTAFPIKVSLIRTSDLAANEGGQFFRQQYLDHLPSGGCARFMIWNNPNFTTATTFAMANPPKTNQRVGGTYDMIDEICTLKNYDPWVCIPYAADDAFITAIATYMRDNIPTGRKIRFELANENWNTGTFTATGTYWKGLAESVWGVADGYVNPSGAWMSYAGKRFAQMMQIINTVFTGQTSRVIGVIGGQAGNSAQAVWHLDAPQWQIFEPGSYVAPHTRAKELSIAPYINFTDAVTQGNALKAQLDISHTAAVNYVLNTMVPAGLAQAKTWIDNHVKIAADRNLRLTMYEYNQHFDLLGMDDSTLWTAPSNSGGSPVAGALDAIMEASYSQQMADAQDELRDYFKSQGGSLMCFFQDYQRGSRFGTWGAKTHFAHNSPPWNDLQTWHSANTRWWAQ